MLKKFYKFIFLFFIPLALFFSFGCEPTRAVRQSPLPGDPIAHFPKMSFGDNWVISGYSKEYGTDIYHRKVIVVEPDGGFFLEVKGEKQRFFYHKYNNRYERVGGRSAEKGKVERILDFPLFVGKKWKDEFYTYSTTGVYRHYYNDYVVDRYENIDTKAGSFKSFRIKRYQHYVGSKWEGVEEYWYSPETKCIVKSIPTWKYGSELLSYSLATAKPLEPEKPKIIISGERVKIGILEFQALNEEARKDNFGKIFTEVLTTSFAKSEAFKIIEREQLQKILKEFELTQSGIIDTSNAKQIGKMVGADAIVIGSVTKIGNDMRLDARIIDVESGIILTAEKSEGETDIKSIGIMAESIVAKLVNRFYKEKK